MDTQCVVNTTSCSIHCAHVVSHQEHMLHCVWVVRSIQISNTNKQNCFIITIAAIDTCCGFLSFFPEDKRKNTRQNLLHIYKNKENITQFAQTVTRAIAIMNMEFMAKLATYLINKSFRVKKTTIPTIK